MAQEYQATECQTKVGIQHHLMSGNAGVSANVASLPLIFGGIPINGKLWKPALGKQGDIVVVVEFSGILGITPPAMVSGVLHLFSASSAFRVTTASTA